MATLTVFILMSLCGTAHAVCDIKIGGMLKGDGKDAAAKKVFELGQAWAANSSASKYSLDLTAVKAYDAATITSYIGQITQDGSVHAIVCPYTSGLTTTCVNAVHASFKGPILAWGGAADSIFDTHCQNKNCFGTFTPASKYLDSAINAVINAGLSKDGAALKFLTVVNNNTFSKSVLVGAKASIVGLGASKANITDQVSLFAAKAALTAGDKDLIAAAMDKNPDVVVVVGHPGDVEPTIIQVGKHAHTPMAVLAVNSLGGNYGNDTKYEKCVVMPTQWDSTSAAKDPVIGWTSTAFTNAVTGAGHSATYHVASAGGALVGLVNALEAMAPYNDCNAEAISLKMEVLNIDSFYGKLKWKANGAIEKPMFMVQSTTSTYITPSTFVHPLSSDKCWGTGEPSNAKVSSAMGQSSFTATFLAIVFAMMSQYFRSAL